MGDAIRPFLDDALANPSTGSSRLFHDQPMNKTSDLDEVLFDLLGSTPGQSEPGNDGNEGVLRIPQSTSITETTPLDCLVSYKGQLLFVVVVGLNPLQRFSRCILLPQPTGQYTELNVKAVLFLTNSV